MGTLKKEKISIASGKQNYMYEKMGHGASDFNYKLFYMLF